METENEIVTEDAKSEDLQTEVEESNEPNTAELLARLKRAEAKIDRMKIDAKVEKKVETELQKKAGELDNADYALLAAKGIEEDEDIKLVHQKMQKWDMSMREVLADKDMQEKLKANKIEREVKTAMPSSTRRSGPGLENLDYWKAKYDRTGDLPDDFELRSAVINAKVDKENTNKPMWQR
jgi:hypothetical protein